jgi:hypothetical protein
MTLRKNMDCPACAAQRLHSQLEWNTHHPYRGHGYTREQGWTHPDLKAEADALASVKAPAPSK